MYFLSWFVTARQVQINMSVKSEGKARDIKTRSKHRCHRYVRMKNLFEFGFLTWQNNKKTGDERMRWEYRLLFLFLFLRFCSHFWKPRRIRSDFNRMALPQITYSNASWRFKAEAEVSGREKLSYPNKLRFMLAGHFGCVLSKLFQILGGLQFHPL